MQHSIDRILTTHAGSIPRGEPLGAMLIDQEQGKPVDQARLDALVDGRVAHVLAKEAEAGIDSANDGEQGARRLPDLYPAAHGRLRRRVEAAVRQGVHRVLAVHAADAGAHSEDRQGVRRPAGDRRAEVSRHGRDRHRDRALQAAVGADQIARSRVLHERAVAGHHRDDDAERALLDASRTISTRSRARCTSSIKSVVDAGFVLQIDAPDLAMERVLLFQDKSDAEYAKIVEQHVATLNKALHGIPRGPRAAACLLGQLGRAAHLRRGDGGDPAGALSGQCRRARPRVRQSAPAARDSGGARSTSCPTTCC